MKWIKYFTYMFLFSSLISILSATEKKDFPSMTFQAASYLTDPLCKSHELFRRWMLIDTLYPEETTFEKAIRKVAIAGNFATSTTLACFTTAPGYALRLLATHMQDEPYLYLKGDIKEKQLDDDKNFSLLSWNVCCVGGGYTISDGGVLPWPARIESLSEEVARQDADVVCLYEVFDIHAALHFYEKLKDKGYVHFYFHVGPRAIGLPFGTFVASKFALTDFTFTPFPSDTLVGRTKNATKGVVSFTLTSKKKPFARVFATHLQHSEKPAFATKEEEFARRSQMSLIMNKMRQTKGMATILMGDLNMSREEFNSHSWSSLIEEGDDEITWGGDGFCARLTGKEESGPLKLDYVGTLKGSARQINTTLVKTGFDGEEFREEALSDHSGLLSVITLF